MIRIVLLLVWATSAFAQHIPYRDGKLWGVCDTNKQIIIAPLYDGLINYYIQDTYPESILIFKKNNKCELIFNDKVYLAASLGYDSIKYLEEKAVVVYKNGKAGYFDNTLLIKPQYDDIRLTSNDRLEVLLHRKKGIITKKGQPIVPIEFQDLSFRWGSWKAKGVFITETFNDDIVAGNNNSIKELVGPGTVEEDVHVDGYNKVQPLDWNARFYRIFDINDKQNIYDYKEKKNTF